MRRFVRAWVLAMALAVGLSACEEECDEVPGTFEPVEGCRVHLNAGENVFAFCVKPPPDQECGGPGGPVAQSWLPGLKLGSVPATRIGCGPIDPALLPHEGANAADGDCCWLVVFEDDREEYCVETEF